MQENLNEPKGTRGGRRAGAGRKSGENPRNIRASFNLSPIAARKLQALSEAEGTSRNDFLNRLLESL